MLGDPSFANVLLLRLLYRAKIIEIAGRLYRTRALVSELEERRGGSGCEFEEIKMPNCIGFPLWAILRDQPARLERGFARRLTVGGFLPLPHSPCPESHAP